MTTQKAHLVYRPLLDGAPRLDERLLILPVIMLTLPPCTQTHTNSPFIVTVMIQAESFYARGNTSPHLTRPPCHQSGHLPLDTHRHARKYAPKWVYALRAHTCAHTGSHPQAHTCGNIQQVSCTHKQSTNTHVLSAYRNAVYIPIY